MSLKNPIKFPVKMYSYEDTGAPQLSDIDGAIKTILKACLVTGYGDKESAGWAMPFEDEFRMVLRRPLRTGNPPDIKIENGIINGSASHRIVSLDNATSLDDDNELAACNLLARDKGATGKWYLFATDFAYMLMYEMAENGYHNSKEIMSMLYAGGVKKLQDADIERNVVNCGKYTKKNGTHGPWRQSVFADHTDSFFLDLRTAEKYKRLNVLNLTVKELGINQDYSAQQIIVASTFILPFFCALSESIENYNWQKINIEAKPFFRCAELPTMRNNGQRALYIPLDFWEL